MASYGTPLAPAPRGRAVRQSGMPHQRPRPLRLHPPSAGSPRPDAPPQAHGLGGHPARTSRPRLPGGLPSHARGAPGRAGFLTPAPNGTIGAPATLQHYGHFFGTTQYSHALVTTLRIRLATPLLAAMAGYPVALVMVRSPPWINRIVTFITTAPLIVSVVVRTYGWQLILANGSSGIMNWTLLSPGLIQTPLQLLYSAPTPPGRSLTAPRPPLTSRRPAAHRLAICRVCRPCAVHATARSVATAPFASVRSWRCRSPLSPSSRTAVRN